jgi:bifunctional oligoribonuclease and PAP phosphatase NrnA
MQTSELNHESNASPRVPIEVIDAIKGRKRFLLVAHIGLDGDHLGSMLALYEGLISIGKDVEMLLPESVPSNFSFLSHLDKVQRSIEELKQTGRYDCVISLECPSQNRLPKGFNFSDYSDFVINFDHHPDNENYGNIQWIDPNTGALGELALDLLLALDCTITPSIAVALYIAILTDTGGFQYSRVTSTTHRRVARLLEAGIDTDLVQRKVYRSGQHSTLKLAGLLLSRLEFLQTHPAKVVISYLTLEDLQQLGVPPEETQFFVDELDKIEGSEVIIFMRQAEADLVKVSLRSRGRAVNSVASKFGGGGHSKAAGCRIPGSLTEAREKLLTELALAFT